jgi:hypothetical protein
MKPYIVQNVRMKSAAGYYLGSIQFEGEDACPYDRDSLYYPSEEHLKFDYPNSISEEEAFQRAIYLNKYKKVD